MLLYVEAAVLDVAVQFGLSVGLCIKVLFVSGCASAPVGWVRVAVVNCFGRPGGSPAVMVFYACSRLACGYYRLSFILLWSATLPERVRACSEPMIVPPVNLPLQRAALPGVPWISDAYNSGCGGYPRH